MGHIHNNAHMHSLINAHTYTHTHSAMLTLARLNLLDDSQLVIDKHRRAEVSLERSRLMEESRKQNSFSYHPVYRPSRWGNRLHVVTFTTIIESFENC